MKDHDLKILPEHFVPVAKNLKKAELRKNDRDFCVWDTLTLREFDGGYTGNAVRRKIIHIADVGSYLPGYVLLSMK